MTEWKKGRIQRGLIFVLLCLLAVSAFLMQDGILRMMKRELPDAMAFRSAEGLGVSFRELTAVRPPEGTAYSMAALRRSQAAGVPAQAEREEIALFLTDGGYGRIAPLEMRYGNYFVLSEIAEENRYVVISDRLAVRFFLTDNAVGRSLRVNGVECRICGVYRSSQGLLEGISSDGRERVYAPYTLVPEAAPQILYVSGSEAAFQASVSDQAAEVFGRPLIYDSVSDYGEIVSLAEQCRRAALFLCGIPVLCLLAALLLRQGRRAAAAYQENGRKGALRPALLALPYLAGIAALLLLVCFRLEIPPQYLPADNIFDLRFYLQTVVSAMQARNGTPMCDFYWNLSQNALFGCAAWGAISFILFLPVFAYGVHVGKSFRE